MKSYISSIETALPVNKIPQMKIAEFMADASGIVGNEKQRLLALYKASGISYRYSVIPDFGKQPGEFQFFSNTTDLEPFPLISDRMRLFKQEAMPLCLEAATKCLKTIDKEKITHIITVSCTGMYAPGLDLEIVEALGLKGNISRTCINFMGCYAAFNALKVADAFCKSNPKALVLIVAVELCTIHYQKSKQWDDILSNALFGDGVAAVIVQAEKPTKASLSVESFYCDIAGDGKKDMTWSISDYGFEMTLSNYVPDLIKGGIGKLTQKLIEHSGIELSMIDTVAIHPGGKRIASVALERTLNFLNGL